MYEVEYSVGTHSGITFINDSDASAQAGTECRSLMYLYLYHMFESKCVEKTGTLNNNRRVNMPRLQRRE